MDDEYEDLMILNNLLFSNTDILDEMNPEAETDILDEMNPEAETVNISQQIVPGKENQEPNHPRWPVDLAPSFHYETYDYTIKQRRENQNSNTWSGMYRCKSHRAGCKKTLKIIVGPLIDTQIILSGPEHTCKQSALDKRNGITSVIDITGEMKELTEKKALENVNLTANEIGYQVQKEMESKYHSFPTHNLTIPQMKSLVYRAKGSEFRDWENAIQNYPLSTCSSDDERLFLQFYLTVRIGNSLEKIIGWGHPDLIFLTKYGPVNLFTDCTFKVVPNGFSQLMVLMIYSSATDMYVPVFFILLQSKHEDAYYHAIQQAICATEWKLEAKTKTCDFEQGLIKALRCQFPGDNFVLCNFHWKQCLRRKLLEYGIPKNLIHDLLGSEGPMELLTVIPIDEIVTKGIPYVRCKINEDKFEIKFDRFWKYFVKTWMHTYSPQQWNINGMIQNNETDKLINRTNNPLERLNRNLNSKFVNAHPNMTQFVEGIKDLCNEYVLKIKNIQRGLDKAPFHRAVHLPAIPEDYETFVVKAKN
jgi:hypothetical protein